VGLCLYEIANPNIAAAAYEVTKKVMSNPVASEPHREDIEDICNARTKLYEQFRYPIPDEPFFSYPKFPFTEPKHFALARLLCNVLERSAAMLSYGRHREAAILYTEVFAIAKGNLAMSM